MTLIHKRKSKLATGTVTQGERIIGHVSRRSRVAAGTKGKCQPFWTAYPACEVNGTVVYGGASLGTRFPSRASAVAALRAWAAENGPREILAAADAIARSIVGHGYQSRWTLADYARIGMGDSAESFKRRHFNSHRPRTNIQP